MTYALAHFVSQCGDILASYGLPGVFIAFLLFACRNLFKKYCEVQEKRITEAQASITALSANTMALTQMAQTIDKTQCRYFATK